MLLDLTEAPKDPIERVMWLSGVKEQAAKELDEAFSEAYFQARLQGRFNPAVSAGPYARKRALAFTRAANERRGRPIRWGDGQDPTSTSFGR